MGVFAIALVGSSSCYQQNRMSNSGSVPAGTVAPEDRLGIDDVFEVRVFGEGDLSGTYKVSPDGTIDFPLAGRLRVAGLRIEQVQEVIVTKLKAGYLKDPQVSVMMKSWNSRKISVLGQVQRAGSVDYFPNMTLVDAIALAGGFTPTADRNKVNLRREVDKKVVTRSYAVGDISEGRSPNVTVLPGDVIVVEERLF